MRLHRLESGLSIKHFSLLQIETEMSDLDGEMADLVRSQSSSALDGQLALQVCHEFSLQILKLQEAKTAIGELFTRIREIKQKTDVSESMVKEITRDIKQLDVAKRNLTLSIATLHHLHILINGVDK